VQNKAAHFAKTPNEAEGLSRPDLARLVQNWILDAELGNRSPRTIKNRRDLTGKLLWFVDRRGFEACGVDELRAFFLYLQNGHKDAAGRWGNPTERQPIRPQTYKTYYTCLRAFFNFAVSEGRVSGSPMVRIPSPVEPDDEVMPFSREEIDRLLKAAGKTRQALRDVAIVYTLWDTGLRAQELCDLQYEDADFTQRALLVRSGKGRKKRQVYTGKNSTRALWKYVNEDGRDPGDPLFLSEQGHGLTYNGLRLLFERLGRRAAVKKCHAHRLRHSFAVDYLKAGGTQLSLMRLLGHKTLTITNRYVQWAEADLQA
jgi:site-specific recombinase XerD